MGKSRLLGNTHGFEQMPINVDRSGSATAVVSLFFVPIYMPTTCTANPGGHCRWPVPGACVYSTYTCTYMHATRK